MNVNAQFSLNDDQRRALASAIAGKPVKRLATRAEVRDFVTGALAAATTTIDVDGEITTPSGGPQFGLSPREEREVERLRKAGKNDSYIRGWLQVGRRLKA